MKKRILSILLAACMLASASSLTACSSKSGTPAASGEPKTPASEAGGEAAPEASSEGASKITVLMPKHEMDNIGFMEKETRGYESESGNQVELINMSWENVADRITTEMAAGGGSYDVIEFDNSWVPKFVTNNWIIPLDDYVTDEMKTGMLPGLIDKFSYDGKLYGITWNNDTRFFMYNKAKLEQAGFSEPPKTWEELKEQTKVMQEKGLTKFGYSDSYMQAQSCVNEMFFVVYSFGGDFFDSEGNLTITTDPGVKAAYEFVANGLNTDKIVDPGSMTSDYETVANIFNMGDTAFCVQAWPGIYQSSNDESTSKVVGEIDVADYSVSGDGQTQAVLTLPEAMAIPKASKNYDAAWDYIKYMSSKEFDKRKAEEIGALPIWSELFNDPDLLAKYPHWSGFGKQAANSKGLPSLLWYDEFANVVLVESQKILLGQVSVDDGLKEMEEQCKKIQPQA
ncbi:ABC transporter substrate-binding protein [Harryflintia acetispora]|uniref:ABC transporter substrate-binding protein n=1 Tax=Harryflintia acetispora TaxID=1849041 RepID=UPI001898A283|nr:extracellular solute-binding protein [Harryflintia acetispora]